MQYQRNNRHPSGLPSSPRSHFAVNGERQPLRMVDSRYLNLESLIAENGQNTVWAATYVEPETGVVHQTAVKKFPSSPSEDQLNQIHKELSVLFMASNRCHHVCKVFGWCHDPEDGALCVVMKKYSQSLCSKVMSMPGGRLPMLQVQKYAKQICIAVAELHEQNIVVADIKPQNVLIDEFDNCVVADFGISTIQSGNKEHNMVDGLHGTFNYMSPEAFDPETFGSITTKSDAWSFACCVVEMVTGKRPWDNTAMSAICYKVTTARSAPQVPHAIPSRAREALVQCLNHDPKKRPTFSELHAAFDEPWDTPSTSGLSHMQVQSASASELEQLRKMVMALEGEKELWEKERAQLREANASEAANVRRLEADVKSSNEELVGAQGVAKKLKDQLCVIVESLKGGERCHRCIKNEQLRAELEHQLSQCNEGLAQCIIKKDTCKEMLRKESERSRQLATQVQQMSALNKFVGWSLQAVICDTVRASSQVEQLAQGEVEQLSQSEFEQLAQGEQRKAWAAESMGELGSLGKLRPALISSDAAMIDHSGGDHSSRDGGWMAEDWGGIGAGVSTSSMDSVRTGSSSNGSSESYSTAATIAHHFESQASTPTKVLVAKPPQHRVRYDPLQAAHC